jgi:hypothetical protein
VTATIGKRVQYTRRDSIAGRRLPPNTKLVGRSSRYGNPHHVTNCPRCAGKDHGNADAVALYREHVRGRPDLVAEIRRNLPGFDLACACEPNEPCHVDVILAVLRGEEP